MSLVVTWRCSVCNFSHQVWQETW